MRDDRVSRRMRRALLAGVMAAVSAWALAGFPGETRAAGSSRAYELVAPEHQGFATAVGPAVGPPNTGVWIDPSGDRIAYGTADPFVGDSGLVAAFLSTRGAGGWKSVGLFPHMPQGNARLQVLALGVSQNFSRVILQTQAPLAAGDQNGTNDVYLWDRTTGVLSWVSASSGTGPAFFEGRSADAHHVLFMSTNNLVPDASGDAFKVYEWVDGDVRMVGYKPDGSLDPGGASLGARDEAADVSVPLNAVSHDGSVVFFSSPPISMSSGADPTRVYVRLNGMHTDEASASQCTRVDCGQASRVFFAGATADGRYVFFMTAQQLLNEDQDDQMDLYRYDTHSHELQLLSAGVGAQLGDGSGSGVLGISNDGERTYFRSASAGLVLWDHGRVVPIASFISLTVMGAIGNCQQADATGNPEVSPDGSTLAFNAEFLARLGAGSFESGFYMYRADTNQLIRIANRGSLPFAQPSFEPDCIAATGFAGDEGNDLVFTTSDPLVPRDVNGVGDVYEWHDGAVSLISGGVGDRNSELLGVANGGADIYFTTLDRLSPLDQDTVQDIYDARIGHVAPQGSSADCLSDDCQAPSIGAVLGLGRAGSAMLHGVGNRSTGKQPVLTVHALRTRHEVIRLSVRAGESGMLDATASASLDARVRHVAEVRRHVKAGRLVVRLELSTRARRVLRKRGQLKVLIDVSLGSAARRLVVSVHG